jgi:hypothetical protein
VWVQLVLLAAQYALGEALRPRPKRIGFEEFVQNNAPSEIRPIAYGGGTFEITPSRIWYGDFTQRAVERDSHWLDYVFLGLSAALLDTITVAYRYYAGEAFDLCYGPDTHIERVTIGDRLMFQAVQGTDNAGGGFLIDDPQAWGGDQPPGEGGIYTWVDITRGNYTDPTNAYLESLLTTAPNKTPSLRGISCAVSRGRSGFTESGYFAAGGIGFIPRFREWKFVLRRQPDNLATGFNKVRGPGESVRRHMNPAETIYEWSVSPEYGARIPVEELNIASFQAAAETFYNEDNGWSGKIEQATSCDEVIKNILRQIDATFDPSPSLGMTLRLIRRDYSFGSLRTLTRDLIHAVRDFTPGAYEGTINKVIVPFFDPDNNFNARPGIYSDPANLSIQGGREVPLTQDYLGVGDYATANMLATRDGRALSVPRDAMTCEVLPSFGRLAYQGEVVKLQWESPTFSRIMRIQSVQPGTHEDPYYTLEMIEDQFATGARTGGEPGATSHTDPAAGLTVAPPSATWNTADFPPDGLRFDLTLTNTNDFQATITGGIVFGSYGPGGQYARVYVTEPGGAQTLSPIRLAPDGDNEATFAWPALAAGEYTFCVKTLSIRDATNDVLVCASITVAAVGSPSVSPSSSESPSASSSLSPSASISPSISSSPSASVSPSSSASSSPSPSPPEDPNGFATIWGWWEPGRDSGTNGVGLQTLTDQSGNARHWTQATEGSRPLYDTTNALNGHAVATFNTDRFWDGPDMSGIDQGFGSTKKAHMFLVVKCDADPAAAGGDSGLWKITGASDSTHFPFTDSIVYDSVLKGSRETLGNHASSLASWRVYEASAIASSGSGVPDGEYIVSLDGVQFPNSPFNVVEVDFVAGSTLGKNLAGQGFKGKMAGLYLFTGKLVGTDRDAMVGYLNTRFGLSIV